MSDTSYDVQTVLATVRNPALTDEEALSLLTMLETCAFLDGKRAGFIEARDMITAKED